MPGSLPIISHPLPPRWSELLTSSRPGKPTDNAHLESRNRTLRAECLDVHWFAPLTEAKQVIEDRRRGYHESRPHRSLELRWNLSI
jgi:transposase InsO family protein